MNVSLAREASTLNTHTHEELAGADPGTRFHTFSQNKNIFIAELCVVTPSPCEKATTRHSTARCPVSHRDGACHDARARGARGGVQRGAAAVEQEPRGGGELSTASDEISQALTPGIRSRV